MRAVNLSITIILRCKRTHLSFLRKLVQFGSFLYNMGVMLSNKDGKQICHVLRFGTLHNRHGLYLQKK